jgi:hypothetical protein
VDPALGKKERPNSAREKTPAAENLAPSIAENIPEAAG